MPFKDIKCGIYQIVTPNGNRYIGSSVNIFRRWSEHRGLLRKGKHHSERLQSAFNKHKERLIFEIIIECDKDILNLKEQEYINLYKADLNTSTFVNNVWLDANIREKILRTRNTEEWKKKSSNRSKSFSSRWREVECSNGMIFKNLTDAASFFGIRAAGMAFLVKSHQIGKLGVKFKYKSEEWMPETTLSERLRTSRLKNGTNVISKEGRLRMSLAKKGKAPPRLSIQKAAEKNHKPVVGTDKYGKDFFYPSIRHAADENHLTTTGAAQTHICKCLHGFKNRAYGLKWRYAI